MEKIIILCDTDKETAEKILKDNGISIEEVPANTKMEEIVENRVVEEDYADTFTDDSYWEKFMEKELANSLDDVTIEQEV